MIHRLLREVLAPERPAPARTAGPQAAHPVQTDSSGLDDHVVLPAPSRREPLRATRRNFLRVGTLGAAGAAVGVHGLTSWADQAQAATVSYALSINAGQVQMIDGTQIYARRFGAAAGDLAFPGPGVVLEAVEGDVLTVAVQNTLSDPHSFKIPGVAGADTGPIPAGGSTSVTFTAPAAGTYMYADGVDPLINRVLGLHGALVVRPQQGAHLPYAGAEEEFHFAHEYVWILHGWDPAWASNASAGTAIDTATIKPRYFTINARSGKKSTHAEDTAPHHFLGEKTLIRIVNASPCLHSPHFHGNHVWVLTHNAAVLTLKMKKDVIRVESGDVKDVLLPFERPPDAMQAMTEDWHYPMHCHTELSQTAAGGLYPSGMITDWVIKKPVAA